MPQSPVAEAELVRRAARGDRAAFALLVARYQRPLVNFAYRYLGRREEAEDAAQEAFIRVYFSLGRLRRPDSFATYLFSTALNLCRRSAASRRPQGALEERLTEQEKPELAAVRQFEHEELMAAIQALPDEYRSVLSLRVDDGLSFAEIGRVVGAEEGTCRVRFHRAKKMLRAALVATSASHKGAL